MSDNHALAARGFYFTLLHVSPVDDRKVYFSSYQLLVSDDGGKTTRLLDRGVHVDHHALWIDPQNPGPHDPGERRRRLRDRQRRRELALVQQPADRAVLHGRGRQQRAVQPVRRAAGQQRLVRALELACPGGSNGSEWFTVAGGDGEYAVPAPSDSTIVYAESQSGSIQRIELHTGRTRAIRPYLPSVERPCGRRTLRYRFNWTTPIEVSRTDANTVYLGAQRRVQDDRRRPALGRDQPRPHPQRQVQADHERRARSTTTSPAPRPTTRSSPSTSRPPTRNVLWVGTDDGLAQVTRDGGKTWTNVAGRFPGLARECRRPHLPDRRVAVRRRHRLPRRGPPSVRRQPRLRLQDGGLREDLDVDLGRTARRRVRPAWCAKTPTSAAFWCSAPMPRCGTRGTAARSWKRFTAGFPTVPVYDVKFVQRSHDLVVATHGRGLFVLDNITPLEELTADVAGQRPPRVQRLARADPRARPAARRRPDPLHHARRSGGRDDRLLPQDRPGHGRRAAAERRAGEPPAGGRGRRRGVIVTVTDAHGDTVVVDSSAPGKQGVNRFTWGLRYAAADATRFRARADRRRGESVPQLRAGRGWLPGTYTVAVAAAGKTETRTVTVEPDPFLGGDAVGFRRPAPRRAAAAERDVRAEHHAQSHHESANPDPEHRAGVAWRGNRSAPRRVRCSNRPAPSAAN